MPEGPGGDHGWTGLDFLILAGLSAAFVGVTLPHLGFVLDDAYIYFRYAEHLAEGHGIVWNVGEDPVEGGTSMLWVLVTAIPEWLGLPTPTFATSLGLAAGGASSWLVYGYARRRGCQRAVAGVGAATMAVSPAFAFVSLQGLETSVAAFLVLLATIGAFEILHKPRRGWLAVVAVALLLAVLARPDLALFGAGLLLGTAWLVDHRHGRGATRRFLAYVTGGLLVPGLAYMAWRWSYFGYPLPNTFYAKQVDSFNTFVTGADQLFGFVAIVIGPLLVLALWRLAHREDTEQVLRATAPPFVGAILFLPVWLVVKPGQGFLWRFQMTILPSLALALALVIRDIPQLSNPTGGSPTWRNPQAWMAVGLVILLVVFPLHPMRTAGDELRVRQQADRVAGGQALAPLEDTNATMFVTESGAVPYYSGWKAVDELGLNNETIAHEGMSVEFLERYDPDLVMIMTPVRSGFQFNRSPITGEYLLQEDYELAAGTQRSLAPNLAHLYFVDPDSPHADEATCRLLAMEGVSHVNRAAALDLMDLPLSVANPPPAACPS